MPRIVVEVPLPGLALARLRSLPGVSVHEVARTEGPWEVPGSLVPGTEIMLCKRPPANLDALADLKMTTSRSGARPVKGRT